MVLFKEMAILLKARSSLGLGNYLQYEAPEEANTWLQRGLAEEESLPK